MIFSLILNCTGPTNRRLAFPVWGSSRAWFCTAAAYSPNPGYWQKWQCIRHSTARRRQRASAAAFHWRIHTIWLAAAGTYSWLNRLSSLLPPSRDYAMVGNVGAHVYQVLSQPRRPGHFWQFFDLCHRCLGKRHRKQRDFVWPAKPHKLLAGAQFQ